MRHIALILLTFTGIGKPILAQRFSTSALETVITHDRMVELGIREMDAGLYMLTEREGCKWFTTCPKTPQGQIISVGPREDPLQFICETGKVIEGVPNYRPDRDWAGNHTWIANVYDMREGNVLAFVHCEERVSNRHETNKKQGVYFRFGLALSRDGGRNWKWLGYIMEPNATFRDWYMNSVNLNIGYANYIIKDGYFYVYYRDNKYQNGKFEEGVAVMRAKVDEVANAALSNRVTVWHKYYNGEWIEPGLNGKFTPLNIPVRGLMHGDAAYNEYLDKYVLVVRGHKWENVNKAEIHISFSDDGITWSDWQYIFQDEHMNDYPSIVSTGDNNEVLGKEFYVYFMRHVDKIMPDKFGKIDCVRVKVTLD